MAIQAMTEGHLPWASGLRARRGPTPPSAAAWPPLVMIAPAASTRGRTAPVENHLAKTRVGRPKLVSAGQNSCRPAKTRVGRGRARLRRAETRVGRLKVVSGEAEHVYGEPKLVYGEPKLVSAG
jgi:hypothetical protein